MEFRAPTLGASGGINPGGPTAGAEQIEPESSSRSTELGLTLARDFPVAGRPLVFTEGGKAAAVPCDRTAVAVFDGRRKNW